MIELSDITGSDHEVERLYYQLLDRKYSISHKKAPTYDEHTSFVRAHPYRRWFFVSDGAESLGNVYVQFDNSIGLNLIDGITIDQLRETIEIITVSVPPLPKIPSVRFDGYFFNIPVKNTLLQDMLLELGCEESQRTFVFKNNLG
jgi:hypothetical protein